MLSLSDNNQADIIEVFNSTSRYLDIIEVFISTARYLDDLLNIDNLLNKWLVRYIPPNFS